MNIRDKYPDSKKSVKYLNYKIIVVEDDEGLSRLIQKKLRKEGYETDGAMTGQEALAKISGDENEILLVDYKLPDMTGKELIEKVVKKFNNQPHFISMTGFGDEKIAVELMKLGAKDYIVKEANFIDLLPEKLKQICLVIDKTRRLEKAEEIIRKQSQLLEETGHMAKVGGWEVDLKTNTVVWSDVTKEIHETPSEHIPNIEEAINFYSPEVKPIVEKALTQAINTGTMFNLELPLITAKGHKIWVHTIGKPEMKDGKCVRLHGINQDITERKNYEKKLIALNTQLKASEQKQKEAKEEAEENEITFRKLFEESSDPILLIDQTGVFVECNQATLNILKMTREQFLFQAPGNISPEYQPNGRKSEEAATEMINLAYKKGLHRFDWTHLNDEGDEFIVDISLMPIQMKGQTMLHTTWRDITERKRAEDETRLAKEKAEESEQRLKLASSSGELGIWDRNLNDNSMIWNERMFELYGINQNTFSNNVDAWVNGLHPDDKDRVIAESNEAIAGGKEFDTTFRVLHPNGTVKYLKADAVVIRDNNKKAIRMIGINKDVTESILAEKSLKTSEAQLKELNATKDKLFSIIAHDLRSPFNNILGFSELLSENVKESNIEESTRYAGIINSAAQNSLSLLDNLLNWAKSQTGSLGIKPEKITLSKVILEVIQLMKLPAKSKNITLNYTPSDEFVVYSDENMLKLVFRNLISNAIKFTKPGGRIDISVISVQNHVEISISDNGVGMSDERCKKLFDASTNTTSPGTANEKGSGLGLVLCKEFVEKLGGNIWVESEEGVGSTFNFTLEYNSGAESKPVIENDGQILKGDTISKKLKILVVEDDETSKDLISIMVKKFAKKIINVSSGLKAVETCRNNPDIDLILMDIQLPGMNGYEATRQIRLFNKDVVILAQTAYALAGDKEKAIGMGCNDYISKPINKSKLDELINEYF